MLSHQKKALALLLKVTNGTCEIGNLSAANRKTIAERLAGGPVPDSRTGVNELALSLTMIGMPALLIGSETREMWRARAAHWARANASVSTREEWIEFAGDSRAAVEFEHGVLGVGRKFLPACAVDVLNGTDGSPAYWQWLREQFESI